jgi:amylosucrase
MTQSAEFDEAESGGSPDAAWLARRADLAADDRTTLCALYGRRSDYPQFLGRVFEVLRVAGLARNAALRARDRRRIADPFWFQGAEQVGYTANVDRFAGKLTGVKERIAYLKELGVTYLHLLPLMKMRPGRNDRGFAVSSYDEVEPAYGSMADLRELAAALRGEDIILCLDFVLNHTADDHPCALAARAGDLRYQDFNRLFPDLTQPDRFEATLPEIFPETAAGNFTFVDDLGAWVWTTFQSYQWDLNYANPHVFAAILEALLKLANVGVDVFRVDATPFLRKREGTDCQNQPEVFLIIGALRALVSIAAPSVILKSEAIVPSHQLTNYLGAGENAGKGCQLAYNAPLMTLLWGALAEGNVQRLAVVLAAMPPPPDGAAWLNYVRCHDEIGWSILAEERAGYSRAEWQHYIRFCREFFSGDVESSFASGESFEARGTSGATASLCGLGRALAAGDSPAADLAAKRVLALYSVAFASGGALLIMMGDEVGLLNDRDYRAGSRFDGDGRWLHRPMMDWIAAERRNGAGVEATLFQGLRELAALRRKTPTLARSVARPAALGGGRVLSLRHGVGADALIVLVNLASRAALADIPRCRVWRDRFAGGKAYAGAVDLPPYGRCWLTPEEGSA